SSSTERWNDVPRGTMDEVSSHVRLDLPLIRRQGRVKDCSTLSSNPMMEGPWCRFRREARARERHRYCAGGESESLKALDPKRPIREADMLYRQLRAITGLARITSGDRRCACMDLRGRRVQATILLLGSTRPRVPETEVMHLFAAGTTFNDVRIPFPHVRVTGLAARSTLENLRREHPTATPIIVGGDDDSESLHNILHILFDERLALPFPPEE